MANPHRPKPNAWQYVKYCYGGRLPASMNDWVIEDLTGKGATMRVIVRMFIPAFAGAVAVLVHPDDVSWCT